MGMNVLGRTQGVSFGASMWSWRPLLFLIEEAIRRDDLQIDTTGWDGNDREGLSGEEECKALADALEKLLGECPNEIRLDKRPYGSEATVILRLENELSMGSVQPSSTTESAYCISKDHALEFVAFLRNCGGAFSIW